MKKIIKLETDIFLFLTTVKAKFQDKSFCFFVFVFVFFFCNKPIALKAATETAKQKQQRPSKEGERGWIFSITDGIRERGRKRSEQGGNAARSYSGRGPFSH